MRIINQAISGTTPIVSDVVQLNGKQTLSGTVQTTGTVNGGWRLFVANRYHSGVAETSPGGASDQFAEILDEDVVAYLALAFAGGGFKPNGTAGKRPISILLPFVAAYFLFTPTAGAGNVQLDVHVS